MTDITKCANGCGRMLLCHRYTAPTHSHRQSMADFRPYAKTGVCAEYWPNAVALAAQDGEHS